MTEVSVGDKVENVILADVGGTNVRFALLRGDVLGPIEHLAVRDYECFSDILEAFLARQPERTTVGRAVFAVAGVVEGKRCALTNNAWVVDAVELHEKFQLTEVHIVNDFEAIAWALPHLTRDDLQVIGGREPVLDEPLAVLGPGTGLGVAAYVPGTAGGFVIRSEGGHGTLPSGSLREDAIVAVLRQRFGHVSAERVLSGPGLENIYLAIAAIESLTVPERTAPEITRLALAGSCATSRSALDIFCAMLGDVAGNFALGFGAKGGVFIAGGIVGHIHGYLPHSQFRSRFEAKGRMSRYVEEIPVYLIMREDPAFVGLRSLSAMHQQKRA